jgi:hypothetical protein
MADKFGSEEVITAIAGALAEWMFAILPLVVVAIVMLHIGSLPSTLQSPEWSFGASVLAGQALVRFVAGVARARKLSLERVLFGFSAVLVVLVGPANVILALVLLAEAQSGEHQVHGLLAVIQTILFCLSSLVYILVAAVSHLWAKRSADAANL